MSQPASPHPAVQHAPGPKDLVQTAVGLGWCAAGAAVLVAAAVSWNRLDRDRRVLLPHH